MTHLDRRLRTLQQATRVWARSARDHALALDGDPGALSTLVDHPAVAYLATLLIPLEHNPAPISIDGYQYDGMRALERVVAAEEVAFGDPGLLLASPGASLSGVAVDILADEEQKDWFYGRLLAAPTWTFLGLTEPGRGSDAGNLETTLTPAPDGLRLDGAKHYIGNAARAQVGVAFARTRPGPLGVTAVLVDTDQPGFRATPLPTLGLRGAQICAVRLDGVHVPEGRVLGRHLSPARRGLWSAVQIFNRLRPGVAAIALGIARAAVEYVRDERLALTHGEQCRISRLEAELAVCRELVHQAAATVDADPTAGYLGSAAKCRATRLAETATLEALTFFGAGARLEHPLLDKFARDARGVEFMEGTGNIQRLNVFQGVVQGRLAS